MSGARHITMNLHKEKCKASKIIEDEFDISIGEDWRTHAGFICDSKRKGAEFPEPYDDHMIADWIISSFQLEHFSTAKIRITVRLLVRKQKK